MASVSITLFREKTVIIARQDGQEEVLATVKSNRILLPLGNKLRREIMVVRGRNLSIASIKSATRHIVSFDCGGHRLIADIQIKAA